MSSRSSAVETATQDLIRGRTAEKRPIVYCRRCLIPETKPDIFFDDHGVCSACRHYEGRVEVDWAARRTELERVLERYRSNDGATYDCVIGVSGGKDSTTQVIRMLELGMNPLCVTATTDELSDIGRRNIENLKGLGVDFLEYTTNPVVRRRVNKLALVQVGDISWPEHVTIFTLPVRIAVQMGIRLIVWGENPQNEYGGPAAAATDNTLTRRWLEEFGGLLLGPTPQPPGLGDVQGDDLVRCHRLADTEEPGAHTATLAQRAAEVTSESVESAVLCTIVWNSTCS